MIDDGTLRAIKDRCYRIQTLRLDKKYDFSENYYHEPGMDEGVAPFFTEAFLYCFLGKEDARSVLYPVERLVTRDVPDLLATIRALKAVLGRVTTLINLDYETTPPAPGIRSKSHCDAFELGVDAGRRQAAQIAQAALRGEETQ